VTNRGRPRNEPRSREISGR